MALQWSNRISFKLAQTAVVIAFGVGILFSGSQIYIDYLEEAEAFDTKVVQSLEVAENAATRAIFILDGALAQEVVAGLLKYDYVIKVEIADEEGQILAEGSRDLARKPQRSPFAALFFDAETHYTYPLVLPDATAAAPGALRLTVDEATGLQPFFSRAVTTFVSGLVRSVLLVMLLYFFFYRGLTQPLNRIVDQLADIDPDQPGEQRIALLEKHRKNELGLLARQINLAFDATGQFLDNLRSTNKALASSEEALRRRSLELEHEISRTAETAQQLKATKEEAEAANRAKSAFLANVSHELRTPLNAVIGFSSIMSEEMFGPIGHEKYREYLADIRTSSEHLSELLGDVLDLAKIEAGQMTIEDEIVDVGSLCEESSALARAPAITRGFDINVRIDAQLPKIKGDRLRIKQALLNLLSNAVKFTPEGGAHVKLHAHIEKDELLIEVTDQGIGIPPEEHELVFSPFMRSASALSRSHEGTGLGLSLVRAFMEMHDGYVSLQSDIDKGTTVILHFGSNRLIASKTNADIQMEA